MYIEREYLLLLLGCFFTTMASGSGTKVPGPGEGPSLPRMSFSRKMTRMPSMFDAPEDDTTAIDSELVPSSLASIAPVLRVANEIEPLNPRVAYLCMNYLFYYIIVAQNTIMEYTHLMTM